MVRTHQNQLLASAASFDTVPHGAAPAGPAAPAVSAATGRPSNISPSRSEAPRKRSKRRGARGRFLAAAGEDPDPEPLLRRSTGSPKAQSQGIGRRFLSYPDLLERGIRFSRVHLRRMERAGVFPMHIVLGTGSGVQTSIAWVADEVIAWENAKIAQRDGAREDINANA
jgi:predicted DNA-binding transcriptional regulator AlpA